MVNDCLIYVRSRVAFALARACAELTSVIFVPFLVIRYEDVPIMPGGSWNFRGQFETKTNEVWRTPVL
jgi:hypothetical protein